MEKVALETIQCSRCSVFFFSSLCSCSLLLYSVCCCFCCANSIADVISCFIYSAVPRSRARSQSKTIFFSLSLLSCKIFTLYLCIWPKSYHLLDYFYSASRWKCINYMYDFSPFMHVFVLFLFLRICQSAEQNNTHTHTHSYTCTHRWAKSWLEKSHNICLLSGKMKHKRNIWQYMHFI